MRGQGLRTNFADRTGRTRAAMRSEEGAWRAGHDVTAAPTSSVMRMVGTGHDGTGHRGAEVAKLYAKGDFGTTGGRRGDKDAMGPLKDNVGLTTMRTGPTDYLRQRDSRLEPHREMAGITAHRAAQIDDYRTRGTAWDEA